MAGSAWLKLDCGIFDHPKTLRLARMLGITSVLAVGHLSKLWTWGVRVYPEGILRGADAEDIATAACWGGDANTFVNALLTCGKTASGFLEYDPSTDEYQFHDWDEYGGQMLKTRRANAEKQTRWRERNSSTRTADRSTTPRRADDPTAIPAVQLPKLTPPAEKLPTSAELEAEFSRLWAITPWKKGKRQALEQYKFLRSDYNENQIVRSVTGYARFLREHPDTAPMNAEAFFQNGTWKQY